MNYWQDIEDAPEEVNGLGKIGAVSDEVIKKAVELYKKGKS